MTDYIAESVKAGKLLDTLQSVHVQRRLAAFKIIVNGLALFARSGRSDEELTRHLWAMVDRFEKDIDFQTCVPISGPGTALPTVLPEAMPSSAAHEPAPSGDAVHAVELWLASIFIAQIVHEAYACA